MSDWPEVRPITAIRADDLGQPGSAFGHGAWVYRTTGQHLANGGMGAVYVLERRPAAGGEIERVVGKTFHANYLYQLRTDDVTRRDHQTTLSAMTRIAALTHPNILPTYCATSIADNHIIIAPLKENTLLEAVSQNELTPRRRVELLMQAMRGLSRLHDERIVHRDFTLRNILLDRYKDVAYLFDFDLAVALDDIGQVTYKDHYRGRIFGSPGYSVAPESLDPGLMECAITQRLDVFAIGAALYGLFTDETVYGKAEDMWGLLVAIADGVVTGGKSRIQYKDTVPEPLRPIIESCLERDPGNRAPSIGMVLSELDKVLPRLDAGRRDRSTYDSTISTRLSEPQGEDRLDSILARRNDTSITGAVIQLVDDALSRFGYQIDKALGRVKGYPIFLASPIPELVAQGKFQDTNTFPKIVTAQNLNSVVDPQAVLDAWFGSYLPVLKTVRQGNLTTLYRAVFDDITGMLLLFSEYVADPRFGTDLHDLDLRLSESLALGYLVTRQVERLHLQGVAHNNVRAHSLLLIASKEAGKVYPAMIGLVEPSAEPAALMQDVRRLAALILSWLRTDRVENLEPPRRARLEAIQGRLAGIAFNDQVDPGNIQVLLGVIADGLTVTNYNWGVLRDNMGDLDDYALMLVSHPLYRKLWPQAQAS